MSVVSPLEQRVVAMDEAVQLQDAFRAAVADFVVNHPDPPAAMSIVASAAAAFAGLQFGQLMVLGTVRESDKRRIVDMMSQNVRTGIEAGKRRGLRLAAEELGGKA